jgi:hypothetical protein
VGKNASSQAKDVAEQLRQTAIYAEAMRSELRSIIESERWRGLVHFRPSRSGVSMIGLTADAPQRGKSGIRDLSAFVQDGEAKFQSEFEKYCTKQPGRPTEEKSLQSFLIAEAYRNNRRMVSLNNAMGCKHNAGFVFVTDEIAVLQDKKIVCDLLALRRVSAGEVVPVLIELKNSRAMSRLVKQASDYAAIIEKHSRSFARLYSAILSEDVTFRSPVEVEKWVVWPTCGQLPDPKGCEFRKNGIRVFCYEKTSFRLHLGS